MSVTLDVSSDLVNWLICTIVRNQLLNVVCNVYYEKFEALYCIQSEGMADNYVCIMYLTTYA